MTPAGNNKRKTTKRTTARYPPRNKRARIHTVTGPSCAMSTIACHEAQIASRRSGRARTHIHNITACATVTPDDIDSYPQKPTTQRGLFRVDTPSQVLAKH